VESATGRVQPQRGRKARPDGVIRAAEMAEQSHRAEMSAAIRAQRERAGLPRHASAEVTESAGETEPSHSPEASPPTEITAARLSLLARLRRRE
jgi:hypothetical protein